ncbi:hypothetical protein ACFQU2_19745 [Siccirubricoccus deserti]
MNLDQGVPKSTVCRSSRFTLDPVGALLAVSGTEAALRLRVFALLRPMIENAGDRSPRVRSWRPSGPAPSSPETASPR